MQCIGEQLRFIRNTVLSELFKNYKQMIRTKKYKRTLQSYRSILEQIEKEKDAKVMKELEKTKPRIFHPTSKIPFQSNRWNSERSKYMDV